MKKTLLLIGFGLSLSLIACNNDNSDDASMDTVTTENTDIPATEMDADAMNSGTTIVPSAAEQNSSVALNPEHGAPGHNCDIPVGAPLNGGQPAPRNVQINPQAAPQPVPQNITPASGNNPPVSGNINPPHGQPGHNCDFPVGAPLN
ncbi:MAG TPA: hypothetical protein VLZ83_09380 [Edaphocola sp.]|nr:hypothetical protein [Edaphocola sp.]